MVKNGETFNNKKNPKSKLGFHFWTFINVQFKKPWGIFPKKR